MRTSIAVIRVYMLLLALGLPSCGPREAPAPTNDPRQFLPASIAGTGWERQGELIRYAGDSLFNYIDGAAELYHKYDFVEVHVATYVKDHSEIVVDVYRFAGPDMAYGLYANLRPDEPDAVKLGAEGFALGSITIFTRGPYVVNAGGRDESRFTIEGVEAISEFVAERLGGPGDKPGVFKSFPRTGRIPHSEKVFAESFVGHGFLTHVYAVGYSLQDKEAMLFASPDEGGDKFEQWAEAAGDSRLDAHGISGVTAAGLSPGDALLLADPYYGRIIAIRKQGWLLGIVGWEDAHGDLLQQWVDAFQPASDG